MKRVQFSIQKNGNRLVYPDDIGLFANVEIVDGMVVADYAGTLPLEDHASSVPNTAASVCISKFAFRSLLTFDERLAVDNYNYNDTLSLEQKQYLRTIITDFEMADEIDLLLADTISGVTYLETVGLIDAGRSAEILSFRP